MEENKLIAEFMGYEVEHNKCYSPKYNDGTIAPMQFHTSWDWLMPVVEKILDLSFQDDGDADDFYNVRDCMPDLNYTYKAVVEFINQNK